MKIGKISAPKYKTISQATRELKELSKKSYDGYKAPELAKLTPVKRNFVQRIWHNILSFIRANRRI